MRKEVLWVIGIGIILGLATTFGVYRINTSFNKLPKETNDQPTPKPGNSEFKITLSDPEDRDVITQDSVTVTGLTKPQTLIVLSGESNDYLIKSDEGGVFTQDVNLIPGVNQIRLTAFDLNGNNSIQKVLVVYSSSFQTASGSSDIKNTATGDANISLKVTQKLEAVLNKPKAYLGVVTDIADSTIQIKSQDSQIQQISTSSEGISVVDTTGTTNKNIKLTDVAIGDFIVAMGYVKANSVLSVQRILVTKAVVEPTIEAKLGRIADLPKGSTDKNTVIKTYSDGKLTTSKLTNIEDEDQIIYVGNKNDKGTLLIRSVFVLPASK